MSLWRLDPQEGLVWSLHHGQVEADISTARVTLVLAGTQSGKTSFGPCWLDGKINEFGPGEYIAASATHDLMTLKMLPELIGFFRGCLGWEYRASDRVIQTANGAYKIFLRSGHQPESLESATAKAAWLDEWGQSCVPVESWEAVMRRLALSRGPVLITTTPYSLGWLYQQVYKRAIGGDPNYKVVSFASYMNPIFPRQEYIDARNRLPAWKFDMFYRGLFTRPAGLIIDGYDDSYAVFGEDGYWKEGGNLVKAFSIPKAWLRDVGIDFGASHHTARMWLAEDPKTQYGYIYREQLKAVTNGEMGGVLRNGPEYAQEALSFGEPIREAFGGTRSEQDNRDEWTKAGLAVQEPRIWEVEAGLDRLNAVYKQHRWFVLDCCHAYRSDLGTYSREVDATGEPTEKISDKDTFHRMDASRYLASKFPLDAPPRPKPPAPEQSSRAIGSIKNLRKRATQGPEEI